MLSSLIFILLCSWLGLLIIVYVFQSKLIYMPMKEMTYSPATINLDYEEVYLTTEDGLQVHGWFIERDSAIGTLLFFHGNAGNISHRLDSIEIFHQLGLSVFIIDYRGYGKSQGSPGEQGSYRDAQAAWDYLVEQRGIPGKEIIIFGRSLGGGVASWLAQRQQAAALVMESSFTSIPDIGAHYYPYLPVNLLAHIRYPSVQRLATIDYPVLVIHSPEDEIVPYLFGKRLYEAATAPKSFLQIRGGHNDGFYVSGEKYIQGIKQFIDKSVVN